MSTYCTSTREPVLDKVRSVHVAEVVSLALVLNCLHLRLIVWTQSLKIIILVAHRSISFPDVLSSSVSHHSRTKRDILITSATVKAILASVDCISNVRTLGTRLGDFTHICFQLSRPHSLGARLVGLILISVILCLISD